MLGRGTRVGRRRRPRTEVPFTEETVPQEGPFTKETVPSPTACGQGMPQVCREESPFTAVTLSTGHKNGPLALPVRGGNSEGKGRITASIAFKSRLAFSIGIHMKFSLTFHRRNTSEKCHVNGKSEEKKREKRDAI